MAAEEITAAAAAAAAGTIRKLGSFRHGDLDIVPKSVVFFPSRRDTRLRKPKKRTV